MAHNYNSKCNSLIANNEENNVSNPQTSDLIINHEKKILSRFDGLDKELLDLKDVIMKDLQVENKRLCMKVNNLKNKVMSLEINGNYLKQYGKRNNLEITGIPNEKKTKTIVQFINRKHAKKALINKKGLININKFSLRLSSSDYIFMKENLTPMNNKIAFHCRKLKRNEQIDRGYSRDGVIHIANGNIMRKSLKYYI